MYGYLLIKTSHMIHLKYYIHQKVKISRQQIGAEFQAPALICEETLCKTFNTQM